MEQFVSGLRDTDVTCVERAAVSGTSAQLHGHRRDPIWGHLPPTPRGVPAPVWSRPHARLPPAAPRPRVQVLAASTRVARVILTRESRGLAEHV